MDLGLFCNRQGAGDQSASDVFDGLVAQTRTARDAGFDLIAAGQHFLPDYPQLQTVPTLSRLAAEAGSMDLATGVLLLPFHHPVAVAEDLATLDAISDGDVVAGVGAGYRDVEFDAFGIPKAERVPRLVEGIRLLRKLLAEEDVTFDGKYYAVEGATTSPRPVSSPPIWLAANATPAVERAARIADAWFVNPHATMDEIAAQKTRYDEIRRERDRDTAVPLFREAFVAETTDEAVETARKYLEPKYERYLAWGQDEAMEDETDLHQSFEDLRRDRFLLGSPAEVAEQLETWGDEIDASHAILRMNWPGMPAERTCRSIELLADAI
jgi:alkanesulfonate monooxygenase SsuD/methylene tetrahydromethanopterin reductase-like flavin-dependent oxidoreductase (luciferase family)